MRIIKPVCILLLSVLIITYSSAYDTLYALSENTTNIDARLDAVFQQIHNIWQYMEEHSGYCSSKRAEYYRFVLHKLAVELCDIYLHAPTPEQYNRLLDYHIKIHKLFEWLARW